MDNKEKILKAEELLKVNKQENVLNFLKKLRLHTLNMLMNISCLMKLKKNIQSLEKM